jgi:hypothetical protein
MEDQGFYNKFETLPLKAQKQVMAFIEFLQNRYETKNNKAKQRKLVTSK